MQSKKTVQFTSAFYIYYFYFFNMIDKEFLISVFSLFLDFKILQKIKIKNLNQIEFKLNLFNIIFFKKVKKDASNSKLIYNYFHFYVKSFYDYFRFFKTLSKLSILSQSRVSN